MVLNENIAVLQKIMPIEAPTLFPFKLIVVTALLPINTLSSERKVDLTNGSKAVWGKEGGGFASTEPSRSRMHKAVRGLVSIKASRLRFCLFNRVKITSNKQKKPKCM